MSVQQGPCPSESCLLVPVPEAEPVLGRLRGRLDRAAAWGVPAHVTILYPFVLPDAISSEVIDLAAAAIASVPAFECTFARTSWFGEDVLWLAPEADVWPALPVRTVVTTPLDLRGNCGSVRGRPSW
jgi:2'-5' RNA ligase superfamily